MLHVQCPGCLASAYLECTCPPDYPLATAGHQGGCTHANIDASVRCGCCPEDHDHAAAANACGGDHDGECHKDNEACGVCRPLIITAMPGTQIQMTGA